MRNSSHPKTSPLLRFFPLAELKLIVRRIGNVALTMFVIAYLTSFGLTLAERGREHLPADPLGAGWESLLRTLQYFFSHPTTYFWHRADLPAFELVLDTLIYSGGLLLLSLGVAFVLGVSLGIWAAVSKNKVTAALIVLLSNLGISMPSFFLAMLFWVINIKVHTTFDVDALPSAGFGWDSHLVMPVLVLAMRPLTQIAQVTYVSLSDIFRQDYIRTAHSKGAHPRYVNYKHALPNAFIPILSTLGASLRFSLASLPVVELFFAWPGVGLTLLQAISRDMNSFVIDLILSLGLFFLVVNLSIEIFFPILDARLRDSANEEESKESLTFTGSLRNFAQALLDWFKSIPSAFRRQKSALPELPPVPDSTVVETFEAPSKWKLFWRYVFGNTPLLVGLTLVLGLTGLVFWGDRLTDVSPYETNGVMMIEGKIGAPPYPPSATFPWGSDYVGRDIQSLVFNGARQTLTLAFFGMLARLALGAILGTLAGWQRGSWLDRFISSAVGVWAAFPITIFAMLLIQGLGIQQGIWVFVVAISVVGWGEVAQIVRSKVIAIKPQLYIESARSTGASSGQILVRHVMPNLVNSLIVLVVLEMGGILMLLAELGYLNIFLGGGFQAMIAEGSFASAETVSFSDVPEWAALIANVREWWRSYPWMALYPGLAFFTSIIAFNLTGEGLRRFLDESQANLSRLLNRYTLLAGLVLVLLLSLFLQGSTPLGTYRSEGLRFDEQRVMQDIEVLSSPEFQGRETGTPGAQMAADYIAKRMEENGLLPAGEKQTYLQTMVNPRRHLIDVPVFERLNSDGSLDEAFRYRQDFAELAGIRCYGQFQATVVGLAFGPVGDNEGIPDPYKILSSEARQHVILVRGQDYEMVRTLAVAGVLVVENDEFSVERKDLYPSEPVSTSRSRSVPTIVITTELAEKLLQTAGSSLADLERMAGSLAINQFATTNEGSLVNLVVQADFVEERTKETYINVLGVIPGQGYMTKMDSQVIMVSAYYDGLGVGPDGTFYPGANDNASAVATLLELARVFHESPYKPEKTVIFVVRAGGERLEGLSVANVLNARPGASDLNVEVVFELTGVGYGTGEAVALGDDSSYRLVQLFQDAAKKYDVLTTTRGRSPHYGHESLPGLGGRSALTLSVSWDGSDALAHTPADTAAIIDPDKLRQVGRSSMLTLMVLARETSY